MAKYLFKVRGQGGIEIGVAQTLVVADEMVDGSPASRVLSTMQPQHRTLAKFPVASTIFCYEPLGAQDFEHVFVCGDFKRRSSSLVRCGVARRSPDVTSLSVHCVWTPASSRS